MTLLSLALLLAVQQAPYSEVFEVRRHNLDVIVTDAKGNHVGGLRAEDFEVLEDGKLQEITNFAEYAAESVKRVAATPIAEAAAPPPPAQAPPPRKFVVFIDEMSMHVATRERFTDSVSKLVEQAMSAEDEAAVLRPADPGKVKVAFTRDRAALRKDIAAALDSTRFRFDSTIERDRRLTRMDLSMAAGSGPAAARALREAARRSAARIRERVEHRLGNLRAVVSALAEQPGRKVIIVVAESLPAEPGREIFLQIAALLREAATVGPASYNASLLFDAATDNSRVDYIDERPVIEEIARSASANGITIYYLQPTYVDSPVVPGGADSRGSGLRSTLIDSATNIDVNQNNEETMTILTEKTGGKWYRGYIRVDDAFRQIAHDVQAYYSMAYRAQGGLDVPHRIAVRVKNRPELTVRARNEVVRRSIGNEVTDRVVASLVGNTPRNDLGIATRPASIQRRGKRDAVATIDVLIPLSRLTFIEENGKRRASFTVHYAVSGDRRDFLSGATPEQVVEVPESEFDKAQQKHWRYSLELRLRQAPYRVGIGVLDPRSQQWGITTVELDTR